MISNCKVRDPGSQEYAYFIFCSRQTGSTVSTKRSYWQIISVSPLGWVVFSILISRLFVHSPVTIILSCNLYLYIYCCMERCIFGNRMYPVLCSVCPAAIFSVRHVQLSFGPPLWYPISQPLFYLFIYYFKHLVSTLHYTHLYIHVHPDDLH